MAKPLIVAETPNAGALGFRYLASEEVPQGIAAAFVGGGRGADEASGPNWLSVRKSVPQRSTGKEARCVLVLAGIDTPSLDAERRAALLKKLRGFLSEVEYVAGQVDWTTEKRRVVPSHDLAALIDAELAALPPAPIKPPSGAGLWLILGALVLVGAIVGAYFAFAPKKEDKGKPGPETKDAGKERPLTPEQVVDRLKNRISITSVPDNLEKIAQEALKLKEDAAFAQQGTALDKVAADARKKRARILKEEADEKERDRLARIELGKKAWPKGTEPRVEELRREEKYADAARALGKKNEAYPEEWERLRGLLASEVLLQLKERSSKLTEENRFDDARAAIAELTKPELAKLDAEIVKVGAGSLDTLNAREDRYRWEDILEAQEAARGDKVRAYLRSPVPAKRGKREASVRVRWYIGDWPRKVTVQAEGDTAGLIVGGKPVGASPARVSLVVKAGDLVEVKTTKGNERLSMEQLMDGVEVKGVKLSMPGMKALPKYDDLPKR